MDFSLQSKGHCPLDGKGDRSDCQACFGSLAWLQPVFCTARLDFKDGGGEAATVFALLIK